MQAELNAFSPFSKLSRVSGRPGRDGPAQILDVYVDYAIKSTG
jgi:hypothetical protein